MPEVRYQSGGQRRHGEHGKPGNQHVPAAEQVAETSPEQEKSPVGEGWAAGHPLQVLLREVQAALD